MRRPGGLVTPRIAISIKRPLSSVAGAIAGSLHTAAA